MLTIEKLPEIITVVRKGTRPPTTHPYVAFLEDVGLDNGYYQTAVYMEYPEEHLDEHQLNVAAALSRSGTRHAAYSDTLTDTVWFIDNDQSMPVLFEIIGSLETPLVWMAYAFQQDSIIGLDIEPVEIISL